MYIQHTCAWCPGRSEEGIRSPETGNIVVRPHGGLRTEPRSSVGAASAVNCQTICPGPENNLCSFSS